MPNALPATTLPICPRLGQAHECAGLHILLLGQKHTEYTDENEDSISLEWVAIFTIITICLRCLQCFDAVGWVAGRASGL